MATLVNPYAAMENLESTLVEDATMNDSMPNAGFSSAKAGSDVWDQLNGIHFQEQVSHKSNNEEEAEDTIEFDDNFQLPPSFSQTISKETLWNNQHPFMLWAMLKIPLPPTLAMPVMPYLIV